MLLLFVVCTTCNPGTDDLFPSSHLWFFFFFLRYLCPIELTGFFFFRSFITVFVSLCIEYVLLFFFFFLLGSNSSHVYARTRKTFPRTRNLTEINTTRVGRPRTERSDALFCSRIIAEQPTRILFFFRIFPTTHDKPGNGLRIKHPTNTSIRSSTSTPWQSFGPRGRLV